jgi:hypothetical protein
MIFDSAGIWIIGVEWVPRKVSLAYTVRNVRNIQILFVFITSDGSH